MSRLIEIYHATEVTRLDETSLPLSIGTDATDHIRVTTGPGQQAYVGESRGHLFLQPAEGGPTVYHNDEHVSGSVWLKSGDSTRIGENLLHWHLAGQRVEVHVTKAGPAILRPPAEAPFEQEQDKINPEESESIVPAFAPPKQASHRVRSTVIGLFLLLLVAAAFVLLAKPLAVTISPAPDSMKIAGFPPVVRFGERYLGMIGTYQVNAERTGYKPLLEEIEISSRGSNYTFSMEKLPGLLNLTTEPSGATLLVDGTPVAETPLQNTELAIGQHTLRLEHPRYLPMERQVESVSTETITLHVELEPAWAIYTLQTVPQGATVAVDGETKGVTPLELELVAGQRNLLFTSEKFTPLEVELDVEAGQDASPEAFQLIAAPALVTINSEPDRATVAVGGTYLGRTPLTTSLSAEITHKLQIAAAGYLPATRQLKLSAGEERQLDLVLEPEYGTIFITSTPPDATLTIDGKKQGKSLGRFQLTTRPHNIKLQAAGYEPLVKTVTPQAGYSQRIELSLTPSQTATKTNSTAITREKTTALGQKLILIKPQAFVMGAARSEAGRRANEGERKVTLQRSFYIMAREVSNAEFRRFRAEHASGRAGNNSLDIDSHPVVNVSWNDAARFMNWLSQQDGLRPFYKEIDGKMMAGTDKGTGYRLPSESEWAYSARVAARKEKVRYPWPGKYPPTAKQGNFADESARNLLPVVIKDYNDGFAASAPTASYPANPAGIFDLGGNVAEWCHDYYAAIVGKDTVDPLGPASGNHHVIRGSSWRDASITELRFSYRRYGNEPASDVGFRVARYAQ